MTAVLNGVLMTAVLNGSPDAPPPPPGPPKLLSGSSPYASSMTSTQPSALSSSALVFSSDWPRDDPMRSAGVASTRSPACNEGAKKRQAAIRGNQKQSSPWVSREHNLARAQSRESTISPLEICLYSLATVVLTVPGLPTKTRLRLTCEGHRAMMSTCMPRVPGSPTMTQLRRSKANQRATEEIRGHPMR